MPLDDDDVVVKAKAQLSAAGDKAQEIGKKPTRIWVVVAALVVGFLLGALVF